MPKLRKLLSKEASALMTEHRSLMGSVGLSRRLGGGSSSEMAREPRWLRSCPIGGLDEGTEVVDS